MVLGKLGFGFVTTYMPDALIRGFTTGAATHVAISQTSSVMGVKIPRNTGSFNSVYVR
jgi:MFS superfamily sulfate permease-like transporter